MRALGRRPPQDPARRQPHVDPGRDGRRGRLRRGRRHLAGAFNLSILRGFRGSRLLHLFGVLAPVRRRPYLGRQHVVPRELVEPLEEAGELAALLVDRGMGLVLLFQRPGGQRQQLFELLHRTLHRFERLLDLPGELGQRQPGPLLQGRVRQLELGILELAITNRPTRRSGVASTGTTGLPRNSALGPSSP